jgi:hypothetical protein
MRIAHEVRPGLASGLALNGASSVVLGPALEPRAPHRRRIMCYWCLERDGRALCGRESAMPRVPSAVVLRHIYWRRSDLTTQQQFGLVNKGPTDAVGALASSGGLRARWRS